MIGKGTKAKRRPGLPREVIFQHLEKPPAASRVSIEFLEQNVWWWRLHDYKLQMWLADQAEVWPNCELANLLPGDKRNQSSDGVQDAVRSFLQANSIPDIQRYLDGWWSSEIDAAAAYEWEARRQGCYPNGVNYVLLTSEQRQAWKKHWKLNLNAVPVIWKEGDPDYPAYTLNPDKPCSPFRLTTCDGISLAVHFELRHGNGHIKSAVKQHLVEERKRRGISERKSVTPGDGALFRTLKLFLRKERRRLGILNPKHEGKDRRPLDRSWADIESIDIKAHSNQNTSTRHRQRESVTRRKLAEKVDRQKH